MIRKPATPAPGTPCDVCDGSDGEEDDGVAVILRHDGESWTALCAGCDLAMGQDIRACAELRAYPEGRYGG